MNYELEDIKRVAELPYDWSKITNKTFLISGGNGFIGSFISDVIRYRNKNYNSNTKIISLSRRGGESDETVEHVKQDVVNTVNYMGNVDYILHLASNTHPKQYGEDPVGTIVTNVIGCDNLLKLAVEKKAKFMLASSVEVYGQGKNSPMEEDYLGYINCNTARAGYNEAKRTCEALCQSYKQQHGIEVFIVRLARIIGADRKNDTKVMSQFLEKALSEENVVLKSQGNQRYSYCYIADAVSGIFKILLYGKNGEAYNVSGEDEGITLSGYAEMIADLAGKKVEYRIENDIGASNSIYALLDISKIKNLGWKPMYSVTEAILRTFEIKKKRKLINAAKTIEGDMLNV